MTLFKQKYRVETTRLKGWDYASSGWYFVTVCTQDREAFFGDIVGNEARLSPIGQIAQKYWQEIPDHFRNVSLDAFVIMPNHLHGILVIGSCGDVAGDVSTGVLPAAAETLQCNVSTPNASIARRDVACNVSPPDASVARRDVACNVSPPNASIARRDVACNVSPPPPRGSVMARLSPKGGSLPVILRSFKSAVARWCYQNRCPSFAWQPRYYDRILRDEPSLIRAREYVANNPLGWEADRDKPEGLWI